MTPVRAFPLQVALLLHYNGANFLGSQFQHQAGQVLRTVQGQLWNALTTLGLSECSPPLLASRTDAGVHAVGQVATFYTSAEQWAAYPQFLQALNAHLPVDCRVQAYEAHSLEPGDAGFHVQQGAQWRWYRYVWHCNPVKPAFLAPYETWCPVSLDVPRMQAAAEQLQGEHDFTSFTGCKRPCATNAAAPQPDNRCFIHRAQVQAHGPRVVFDVVARRYRYTMVRSIAGTLERLGRPWTEASCRKALKRQPYLVFEASKALAPMSDGSERKNYLAPPSVLTILDQRNRQAAFATAPACGLTLMAIAYNVPLFQQQASVQALSQLLEASAPLPVSIPELPL